MNPLQLWLLGLIDAATLHDRLTGMGECGAELLAEYGRVQGDPAYAAELLAGAQRAMEAEVARDDQAYAMYEALVDPFDAAVRRSQAAEGQPVGHIDREHRRALVDLRPLLGIREPERVVGPTVHVRLLAGAGSRPFAEFQLSEADLAGRIDPVDRGTHAGTIAHQAADTAWFLTELAARGGDVEAAGYPVAYVSQITALRERRAPAMGVGELAEVTRASGARSVWRCSNEGWELVHRESAAEVARRPPPAVGPDPEAIIEAER